MNGWTPFPDPTKYRRLLRRSAFALMVKYHSTYWLNIWLGTWRKA